ncbi:hypothetical protein [Acinetobacter sp. YH12153]|uniref:hypothetical protein n=1 Tax=Acinetobacter sp. YH12153 TaxID=2601133 RepID=UPI0015D23808|nr:hypothetical protein [Acinetobacter sp. YH12153]
MKTLNLHLIPVEPGVITSEFVLKTFQAAHPEHQYQAALVNALNYFNAHIAEQSQEVPLFPLILSMVNFQYDVYGKEASFAKYLKTTLHSEIVNVYRSSIGPDQDNKLSGEEINQRSDAISENAHNDLRLLATEVVEALMSKLAKHPDAEAKSIDVSVFSGLHSNNVIHRLLLETYDDETGHVTNSSQFYYEARDSDVTNAYFLLMDGSENNEDVQKTYSSVTNGLNLFNEIVEKFGKISVIGFLKANHYEYYYTFPYKHAKPLDELLEKQFGAHNIISLALATFGQGWKDSVLQSGLNKSYGLLTLDDLEQLNTQTIAPESVSTAVYAICKAHADAIDQVQAKLKAYREKIGVNMI